ncbi:iron-sulfur cluster-binding flavodoxin [Syntrophotalea carbinolica DSM 2380]|uniref:Iron-sulfur cluster-binding flavodoxin n=1 Tax=Syntrophotalea carbinolica (strain DSM 2380 / NBRC 103641 / GraBd1) TaxID=338963 RepID=Q3A0G7_SYNC1|nr:4Fe-4S binding protein [Syntrophotalea carbinolica]ABA90140.1 iron-sulfur cluster-binding flavodoxin [Syntrophotalea carbinolica DSM 2380]
MQTAHLIYFSPTGTTRKAAEAIAQGVGASKVIHYDLTLPGATFDTVLTEGVAVIGIPVYAGRLPELCLQRLQAIRATRIPAVLVALYGNREFDDALVELRDLSVAKGFDIIAAGAFIGEHSFSTPSQPIAAGRPDAEDLKKAVQFGRQVAGKLRSGNPDTPDMDGHVPYKDRPKFGGKAPQTDVGQCILCGKCAAVCPSGAITVADSVTTDAENCIMCCACTRACDNKARSFTHPWIEEKRAILNKNCAEPKMPEIFI